MQILQEGGTKEETFQRKKVVDLWNSLDEKAVITFETINEYKRYL